MAQILIRALGDDVIGRLEARTLTAGKSPEDTVRDILTGAAKPSKVKL